MPSESTTSPEARRNRPRGRVGLAAAMALVAVLALGLALMKVAPEESDRWAGALFLVGLLGGTLGLLVRRDRAPWVGFALFGWAYALVALVPPLQSLVEEDLPTDEMVDRLVIDHIQPVPVEPAEPLGYKAGRNLIGYYKLDADGQWALFQPTSEEAKAIDIYMIQVRDHAERKSKVPRSRYIFYKCAGLAFALVGAIAGRVLSDRAIPPGRDSDLQPSSQVG